MSSRPGQPDLQSEFQDSQGYREKSNSKNKQNNNNKKILLSCRMAKAKGRVEENWEESE